MSEEEKSPGARAFNWWKVNIEARDRESSARALSARLRRGDKWTVLSEPAVHEFHRTVAQRALSSDRLIRVTTLLARIRTHEPAPLPRRLGGSEPILSRLRFQKLMRAEGDDLTAALRRAIDMADNRCNVFELATDLMRWDDRTRTRWWFHYFGDDAPSFTADKAPVPAEEN